MKLAILGSSSKGNGYILRAENEALGIELGVNLREYKKALNYDLPKLKGVIVSHSHGDHAKSIKEAIRSGIDVYSSKECFQDLKLESHRLKEMKSRETYRIGGFKVMPFDVVHDVKTFGFLISHNKMGKSVFITDTHYVPFTFKNIDHFIVEANYSSKILDDNVINGRTNGFLRDRIMNSHLSLETCIKFLKAHNLKETKTIILTHLSDSNSNEKEFKKEVISNTGKSVYIAKKNKEIELWKN